VEDPHELVRFRHVEGRGGRLSRAGENNGSVDPVTGRNASTSFSVLTFERFRSSGGARSRVFAFAPFNRMTLLIDGQPETSDMGQSVSGGYFAGLGVSAIAGRTLTDADDRPAAPPVGVMSLLGTTLLPRSVGHRQDHPRERRAGHADRHHAARLRGGHADRRIGGRLPAAYGAGRFVESIWWRCALIGTGVPTAPLRRRPRTE
jgi:hypothetical protein